MPALGAAIPVTARGGERRGARGGPWRVALAAAAAAVLGIGCAGGGEGADPDPRPSPRPQSGSPATEGRSEAASGRLAVGLTEPNALLYWSPTERPLTEPFARWRREVGGIRPAYFRIVLDWASLQPAADRRADLALPQAGCMRAIPPCSGFAGVRDQLRALASRQREGDWEAVVVITGSPTWAVGSPEGCERRDTEPRSRTPKREALPAYERLVRDVLAEARAAGAQLRWWSAWNEPNRYVTLSPQRAVCRAGADSIGAERYAPLVRALKAALEASPGDQRYILGDLGGGVDAGPGTTTVREFIRDLPTDLVCGTSVFAQHAYVGDRDPVRAATTALSAHDCRRRHEIWITQTGAPVSAAGAAASSPERRRTCEALHRTLRRWYRDPSVTAAFQYTVREDDLFRVGLVDTRLRRAFPALRLWQAWGGQRRRASEDPPPTSVCR